jgi:hypothetical protein
MPVSGATAVSQWKLCHVVPSWDHLLVGGRDFCLCPRHLGGLTFGFVAPLTAADEMLAEAIHAWVHIEVSDEALVDRMTQLAMSYRESGATVDETCEWVQHLVKSWLQHPTTTSRTDSSHLHLVPEGAKG